MTEAVSRDALIDILWIKAEPMVFIPKEDFSKNLSDWSLYPIVEEDEIIAVVGEKGPHMHFETTGSGKPISRRVVRTVLRGLINKHGFAVTKTPKEETRQRRFNEMIGFKMVGEDEYDIHYRIEQIRGDHVSRSASCL